MSNEEITTNRDAPVNPAGRREILSWAFYDFANSGYTTVVLTTIYSAYFVGVVAADIEQRYPGTATLLWTLSVGIANFCVLLSGPVVGGGRRLPGDQKSFFAGHHHRLRVGHRLAWGGAAGLCGHGYGSGDRFQYRLHQR